MSQLPIQSSQTPPMGAQAPPSIQVKGEVWAPHLAFADEGGAACFSSVCLNRAIITESLPCRSAPFLVLWQERAISLGVSGPTPSLTPNLRH